MPHEYEVNTFYWIQGRRSGEYHIAVCVDPTGRFKLSEDSEEVDTEEFKPIGPATKDLAYYIGEDGVQDFISRRLGE